jgi:hypothetical protein
MQYTCKQKIQKLTQNLHIHNSHTLHLINIILLEMKNSSILQIWPKTEIRLVLAGAGFVKMAGFQLEPKSSVALIKAFSDHAIGIMYEL